ncbi:MAG: asparagine--tRNA ligase [Spirochaetaceae bacterium]|jgi:asparaginyl-tRNA synthetase|nr:asparagine--tRNA ligase [Spirochaetaceae bacterium]
MLPLIKDLLTTDPSGTKDGLEALVRGWVRTKRDMKNLVFIEVNDGSSFANIQCTFDIDSHQETAPVLAQITTGCSVEIKGRLIPSPAAGQRLELAAGEVRLIGDAPEYPMQKKRHSLEYLRENAHLRARTNTFGAVARVRNRLAFAIHQFFQERGFQYVNTPIITASDAEGAGAMFQVTTLESSRGDAEARGGIDYSKDFFGKRTSLTVSGQLEAETYATALSRCYTFGPTFRAENSNTSRHLAEFWMVEPEFAFAHLEDDMALAEDFLKHLFQTALKDCAEDLAFFNERVEKGIIDSLHKVANAKFAHLTYTEAIAELEKAVSKGRAFDFKPFWGCDLQSEHERYLTENLTGGPVIVTDYPKEIKAFYMKQNDDGKTVRAMDVLVPRLGEIIGGSEREDNLEKLEKRMTELGLKPEDYYWYLDLRRYGSVPHVGFGLGFERLVQYVTGMQNIRDVIPYPRAVGLCEF